jgi:hypothetical protein
MDNFLVWKAWFIDRKYIAIILVPVLGIPILADNYYNRKYLGKPLLAYKQGYRYLINYI